MKQINIKQAEKWLQKLRETDYDSYKQFTKYLKKFDKSYDQYQCFVKMNSAIAPQPKLVQQLNNYLQKGNQMFYDSGDGKKRMGEFLLKIKHERPEQCMNGILRLIQQSKKGKDIKSSQEMDLHLKLSLMEYFKDDAEMQTQIEKIFIISHEDTLNLINKQYLPHLKGKNGHAVEQQASVSRGVPSSMKKNPKKEYAFRREKDNLTQIRQLSAPPKSKKPIIFMTPGQEKYYLSQFQKKNKINYAKFAKILFLYKEAIITLKQFLDLVAHLFQTSKQLAEFKDIVQSRQDSRRKLCKFRPLADSQIANQTRITPSYIFMPPFYPSTCSNKNQFQIELLNTKCITVPLGTEQFNIRPKNVFQISLLFAQDAAYEVDICLNKINKCIKLLVQFKTKIEQNSESNYDFILNKALKLGIIQYIYKQANKEQESQLQYFLKHHEINTINFFIERLRSRYDELKSIKNIHGHKNWLEVSSKNYYKSLDVVLHQFKRVDKIHSRPFLMDQLKYRINNLKNKFKNTATKSTFDVDGANKFFSIYNSFQSIIKGQKCNSRILPQPKTYNLQQVSNPMLLPVYIFAFQNTQALKYAYSFIIYYLENGLIMIEGEKMRCHQYLQFILHKYLDFNNFERRFPSSSFQEDALFNEINLRAEWGSGEQIKHWLTSNQQKLIHGNCDNTRKYSHLQVYHDSDPINCYQPHESQGMKILYSNENLYIFMRFFYTLYQRIIKMLEVSSPKKIILFQLLYYACMKTKQTIKFQEALHSIFSKYSYIYTTFYKLLQNTIRSLNTLASCSFTNYSLSIFNGSYCEQIYQNLLNHYMINLSIYSNNISRWAYNNQNKILYMNVVQIFDRLQDKKDMLKRRQQVNGNSQIYVNDPPHRILVNGKQQNRLDEDSIQDENNNEYQSIYIEDNRQVLRKNEIQYSIEPNYYELIVVPNKEDILVNQQRKSFEDVFQKQRQIKKMLNLHKFLF